MKCVILAAGYATRLYPLTENFPKPLLEVQGKTILDWLLEDIASTGRVNEFIVVSNYKFARHFQEWAAARPQWKITVLDDGTTSNETRIGAVRDIALAVEKCRIQEEMLVIAGDNLLDFSLKSLLGYARRQGTSCIMRYAEPDVARLRKCGVLSVDDADRVLSMVEKPAEPPSHWCCPPFYYFIREDVSRVQQGLDAGCGIDAPGSFIAWLCSQVAVHAMEMPGARYDIGNLESYRKVQESYRGILV